MSLSPAMSLLPVQADAILQLGEEIGTKLAKAESCGAEGNIEESMKLMAEVDELNKAKAEAEVGSQAI